MYDNNWIRAFKECIASLNVVASIGIVQNRQKTFKFTHTPEMIAYGFIAKVLKLIFGIYAKAKPKCSFKSS